MTEQSSIHSYLNWAKERFDEMDAAVASLEAKASQATAEARAKADQLIAELKKRRDEFRDITRNQQHSSEAAWERVSAKLESEWRAFEAQIKTYVETFGKQFEQQAIFQAVAAAQAKAWHNAADKFHKEAAKVTGIKRADIDAAVKKMKVDAVEAQAHLQKLKQTGEQSWSALSAALAESRKVFDRANQAAWDALKQIASSKDDAHTN